MSKVIPTTLEECFAELDKLLVHDDDKAVITETTSPSRMIVFHHNLGQYIRNEWGLWTEDSEIFKYFKNLGVWHPDDISGIILDSYWLHKRNLPLNLDEQVKQSKDYWKGKENEPT